MTRYIAFVLLAFAPVAALADKNLEKSGAWDCKKDPTLSIANGAGKYTIKGKCTKISIGGGANTVVIESVDTLDIGGAQNTVTVGTVETIDVGGSGNTITWKKAKTGDAPTLKGQPDKNKISQGK